MGLCVAAVLLHLAASSSGVGVTSLRGQRFGRVGAAWLVLRVTALLWPEGCVELHGNCVG